MIQIEPRTPQTLHEIFSNWKYTLPDDPEQLMYDFYFLVSFTYGKDAIVGDPKANAAIKDGLHTIVNQLKHHMLQALRFSIAAELQHLYDMVKWSKADPKVKKRNKDFLKTYTLFFTHGQTGGVASAKSKLSGPTPDEVGDKMRDLLTKETINKYKASYVALRNTQKELNLDDGELGEIAKDLFDNLPWQKAFGGDKWGDIAEGLTKLYDANSIQQKMIWIDHAYDLQHNTDVVFNKLQSYYKNGTGFGWVLRALNWKRDAQHPIEFYPRVSQKLRPIVAYISKNRWGMSVQQAQDQGIIAKTINAPQPSGGMPGAAFDLPPYLKQLPHQNKFKSLYVFDAKTVPHLENVKVSQSLAIILSQEKPQAVWLVNSKTGFSIKNANLGWAGDQGVLFKNGEFTGKWEPHWGFWREGYYNGVYLTQTSDPHADYLKSFGAQTQAPSAQPQTPSATSVSASSGEYVPAAQLPSKWTAVKIIPKDYQDIFDAPTDKPLKWLFKLKIQNAVVVIDLSLPLSKVVIVYSGAKIVGPKWRYGTVQNSEIDVTQWMDGRLINSTWRGKEWRKGTAQNVLWEGGTWLNGSWKSGEWLGGDWKNGTWWEGTWQKGDWSGGKWKKGSWMEGYIYSEKFNAWVKSQVNPRLFYRYEKRASTQSKLESLVWK